jgi:hypothetical protein
MRQCWSGPAVSRNEMKNLDDVFRKLPALFQDGEDLPADLIGATILQIGTTDKEIEGGDFVIDYAPKSGMPKRLLMPFWGAGNMG